MTRPSPPKTTRARPWRVFERRFQPIARPDCTMLWEASEVPHSERNNSRHWWTVLDCDGHLYLSTGFCFVNRLAYLRCAVPWSDADAFVEYRYD
ncbi:MAG: hypothetical protein WBQ49_13815 [Rhodomicrobium sp.]